MNNIIQTIRHAARAAAVLLLALLTAQTAGAQKTMTVTDVSGFVAAFNNTTVSEINVTDNITGVGNFILNRDLTINLDGHTISGDGLYIEVYPYGSLTINGGGQDGSVGNIISGKAYGPAINNGGTVTLSNVNIITYPGNAINGGTLNIGDNVSFKYISDIDNASGLAAAFNNTNVGVINVTDDITGVGGLPFLNRDLTINLNGHTISGDGLFINVNPGRSLTINGEGEFGNVGNIISGYADRPAIYNRGTVTLSHVNITTNYDCAIQYGTLNIGNNVSFNGWTVMPFNTPKFNIIEGGDYNFNTVVATVTVGGVTHYFENSDIALAYITNNAGKVDFSWSESDDTYTIHTATGWDVFCDLLANKAQGFFTGKTVQLGADIGTADAPVTSMAGGDNHDFTGTFDGQGHTLTVNYANTDNNVMTAPFSYVDGATIRNLIVDGTISGSAYRAAGIIGETGNTTSHITNCVSSVTISGDRYTGGFSIGGNVAIEGCVFNGKINATSRSGGFIGHSNSAQVIKNSLFAPKDGSSISGGTFYYNGGGDVDPVNSYYTRTLGDAQGKALHSVTAGDGVTLALSGTATEYTVSGITAYEGNQGIKYGTTYYAGSDDVVRLTLSNTATGDVPEGYKYGYTASAGTLIGSTLTMPAEDVTVSPALRSTGELVPVSYVDARGNTQPAWAIALDGTESYLDRDDDQERWYFVGLPTVAFDHTLYLYGDVHLILADGCTMNVTSNADGIDVYHSLTIYGQTDGTGTLNATGHYDGIFTDSGTITISGGRVTATGGEAGIYNHVGTITLGCTTASDFIYASRYYVGYGGSLNIAGGQSLYDEDGRSYMGNGVNIPAGKTLRLSPGIALTARQAPDGNYWTTYYNSTLGFTIDENENACAYTATYGDGKLTLHNLGKQIPKNTAVIIVAENNVVSMTATTDLAGTFYVLGMTTVNGKQHFGFHRYTGEEMAAHKAFVLVSNGQAARSLTMVFDEATGIESLTPDAAPKPQAAEHWFTLDGRRLQAKPTAPGIYINNGKKVVIK